MTTAAIAERATVLDRLSSAPDAGAIDRVVSAFAAATRATHGAAVVGLYLFGSRARGDARPDSDIDIAVVFADPALDRIAALRDLSAIAYDILVDEGVRVDPLPISAQAWAAAATPALAAIRRHARHIG